MSYINTQLSCELPIFKDKVMYINPTDSDYKLEQSYVISASYKGILRLSPNNYNTVYETNPIELSPLDDNSISYSYSDAIVFEDNAIVKPGEETEAKKVNADIRYRMIIGSDSDGYLVNFRMSDVSVEFDKLGVIGMTETKKVTIYSDCQFSDRQAFTLGNTIMPSLPNELDSNVTDLERELSSISGNTKTSTQDWDEIEIDITGDGDQSYMLYGYPDNEGRRTFEYKRSQQFIRDIVMEALLSVKSVATGSIHWLPVTYEQYAELVNDGKQFPNHYFRKNVSYKDTEKPADPIIRDYLICDGRKHKSAKFPELAKILWGETITYWDKDGRIQKHKNGSKTIKSVTDSEGNRVEVTIYDDYFRVPDLRAKFISYVYAKGAEDALNLEPEQIHKWTDTITYPTNVTGYYTPDNAPKYKKGFEKSPHFHFIAYGTYNGYNMQCTRINTIYKFQGFKFAETDLSSISNPRIWYLQTTAGDHSVQGNSSSDDGNTDPGWGYGFGSARGRRRSCSTNDIVPACAYASAPTGGHNNHKTEPTLGLSSKSKMIFTIPTSNTETYKITKYENITTHYIDLESGISKTETTAMTSRYGHENAPKFYAMIPLIKI